MTPTGARNLTGAPESLRLYIAFDEVRLSWSFELFMENGHRIEGRASLRLSAPGLTGSATGIISAKVLFPALWPILASFSYLRSDRS